MMQHSGIRLEFFDRLHELQGLYSCGRIFPGSKEHMEIIVLEEMESLFVQQQMKQLYETELKIFERTNRATPPVDSKI
jgi:hypothetical protein